MKETLSLFHLSAPIANIHTLLQLELYLMKNILFLILFLIQGVALAETEVSVSCSLHEQSKYTNSKREVLPLSTLNESGISSLSIKPNLALDNSALYLLSLSIGEEYTDADGEVVGNDYYLSLIRANLPQSHSYLPTISGTTQKILKIEAFDGRKAEFTTNIKPKNITLKYKIGQRKIKLNCQILSVR
jgi:hypothetical protein